jgi:hypothetical protein
MDAFKHRLCGWNGAMLDPSAHDLIGGGNYVWAAFQIRDGNACQE